MIRSAAFALGRYLLEWACLEFICGCGGIVLDISGEVLAPLRHRIGLEEHCALAECEALFERKLEEPSGRGIGTVQINDGRPFSPEVVRKALKLERGSPSDDQGALKQRLKRYDGLLPCQGAKRTLESPTRRLNQPAETYWLRKPVE